MVSVSRDFYLRRKPDGTIAFRIKVPIELRQAFGRSEIQIKIPHRDIIPQLGDCCREHFSKLEEVAPMVEAFNPQKVRQAVRAHMEQIILDWREGPPLDTDDKWYCELERVQDHILRLSEWIGTRQFVQNAGPEGKGDPHLSRELLLGELKAYEQIKDEMQQGPHESLMDSPEPVAYHKEPEPGPAPQPPESLAPATNDDDQQDLTLRDALDQFVDHKLTTGKWTDNTVKDMNGRMKGMFTAYRRLNAAFSGRKQKAQSRSTP